MNFVIFLLFCINTIKPVRVSRLMPRVSTALNVLSFIISGKGGDPETSELISTTWTVPNYSAGITASPGSWWHRTTLAKTTPDLPCSPSLSLLEGNRVTLLVPLGFFVGPSISHKKTAKVLKGKGVVLMAKGSQQRKLELQGPQVAAGGEIFP